jgi:hypothetical protein
MIADASHLGVAAMIAGSHGAAVGFFAFMRITQRVPWIRPAVMFGPLIVPAIVAVTIWTMALGRAGPIVPLAFALQLVAAWSASCGAYVATACLVRVTSQFERLRLGRMWATMLAARAAGRGQCRTGDDHGSPHRPSFSPGAD